MERAEPSIV